MAFNRVNLAGIAEHTPGFNNSMENQISRIEFDTHVMNNPIHVSIADRQYWNSIERKLKDYIDYRFKTIVGKFDFGEIGLDNSLTLSEIILRSNKERIADVQSERAERNAMLEKEMQDRITSIESEVRARTSAVALIDEQLLDINNRIDKEIQDRIDAITTEAKARFDEDKSLSNSIEDTNKLLDQSYRQAIAAVELEAVKRANADLEVESRLNRNIGDLNTSFYEVNNTVQSFVALHSNDSQITKDSITRLQSMIVQETQDRIAAVNQEATSRLAADNDLYNKIMGT